jgi:hypothetical protein
MKFGTKADLHINDVNSVRRMAQSMCPICFVLVDDQIFVCHGLFLVALSGSRGSFGLMFVLY